MAYSQQFYERLAAKLSAYIDTASAGVLARMGTTPPFAERKTPAERYQQYLADAASGSLEPSLRAQESTDPGTVESIRGDIAKLLNLYGYTGPPEAP